MPYALTREHLDQGAGKDLEVEPERAVLHVPEVEGELLLPFQRIAAVDLRPAGDPRPHVMAAPLALTVEWQVLHQQWARPHEAHVAAQDVPELRQLVQRACTEPPPQGSETLCIRQRDRKSTRLNS